jgi:hypothetical protein
MMIIHDITSMLHIKMVFLSLVLIAVYSRQIEKSVQLRNVLGFPESCAKIFDRRNTSFFNLECYYAILRSLIDDTSFSTFVQRSAQRSDFRLNVRYFR